jgi:type IV pilus assembly protein PilV
MSTTSTLPASREAGFLLVEALVSMMIVAVALLGAAGMQSLALKMNRDGQIRSQAILAGDELYERMEANHAAAVNGAYATAALPVSFRVDCGQVYCGASDLAQYDLVLFRQALQSRLPGSDASIVLSGRSPYSYTVSITWLAAKAGSAFSGPGAVGAVETLRYSFNKTIHDPHAVF